MAAFDLTPRTMDCAERDSRAGRLRERLLSFPEILVACLHGSFAEGRPFRDVDVAIWLDPDAGGAGDWRYAAAVLDICNHLVARRGGRSPSDYADCIAILGELGVIDADLTARLVRMARFRNLLVHLDWRVDDRQVYRVMHDDLGDVDAYLAGVRTWLGIGPDEFRGSP